MAVRVSLIRPGEIQAAVQLANVQPVTSLLNFPFVARLPSGTLTVGLSDVVATADAAGIIGVFPTGAGDAAVVATTDPAGVRPAPDPSDGDCAVVATVDAEGASAVFGDSVGAADVVAAELAAGAIEVLGVIEGLADVVADDDPCTTRTPGAPAAAGDAPRGREPRGAKPSTA